MTYFPLSVLIVFSVMFPSITIGEGVTDTTLPAREKIFQSQGVANKDGLNCETLDTTLLPPLGEAILRDGAIANDPAWEKIKSGVPKEKQDQIYTSIALGDLGCIKSDYNETLSAVMLIEQGKSGAGATPPSGNKSGIPQSAIGFVAAWTTLVWLFSVMGFGVFMVWITSGKFRFQFRKMAEGELEDEGKALDILKERYARGEITKEQFDKMRKDIVYS